MHFELSHLHVRIGANRYLCKDDRLSNIVFFDKGLKIDLCAAASADPKLLEASQCKIFLYFMFHTLPKFAIRDVTQRIDNVMLFNLLI